MKTFVLILALLVSATTRTYSQQAQPAKPKLPAQSLSTTRGKTNEGLAATSPKLSTKPFDSQIFYNGFLVEFLKAEKPFRMIDPRSPLNPPKDSENLYRDPQSGKIKGFVLFAIKF